MEEFTHLHSLHQTLPEFVSLRVIRTDPPRPQLTNTPPSQKGSCLSGLATSNGPHNAYRQQSLASTPRSHLHHPQITIYSPSVWNLNPSRFQSYRHRQSLAAHLEARDYVPYPYRWRCRLLSRYRLPQWRREKKRRCGSGVTTLGSNHEEFHKLKREELRTREMESVLAGG